MLIAVHIWEVNSAYMKNKVMLNLKLFTVKFNSSIEKFDDLEIRSFINQVDVKEIKFNFFESEKPYWTVAIMYFDISDDKKIGTNFNEEENCLYEKLKQWRNDKAKEKGFPPYLIATNKQLEDLVIKNPLSIEEFKLIRGIGKKKASEYGLEILNIIKDR